MKKIIIFSIVFIGLFMAFNFTQAKTTSMAIPLELSHLNNLFQQIKGLFLSPVFAETTNKNIGFSCDLVADGSDKVSKKYFEFITNEQVCYAQEGHSADLELNCDESGCYYNEAYPYECGNTAKWKIIDATIVTTSMDENNCEASHFDDYDQCMMAIYLIKSMDIRDKVASSTFIQCAASWSVGSSIGTAQPADNIPSGAGYVELDVEASGGSTFGDEVYWKGTVEAVGQRPSIDDFKLIAVAYGATSPSIIRSGQSMTVCEGTSLGISWSASDSTQNILYVGATAEHHNGEELTVGNNGSISRTAYISTDFNFTVKGFAGEAYEQTFRSDPISIDVVSCPALTLSTNLIVLPDSGSAPLNDVDLRGNVYGTATGSIVYKFDCTDNGTWEHTSAPTTADPYTIADLCDYATAGTYTAKLQVTREGLTAWDKVTISVAGSENSPPNIPTLIYPPNDEWINLEPEFEASSTDQDNDKIKVYFNIAEFGSGWGNLVNSGQSSTWDPGTLGSCSQYFWRGYAQDEHGLDSAYSGYWFAKLDTGDPIASISYTSGTIDQLTIPVTLTESDSCSGIAVGDVDARFKSVSSPNWPAYTHYLSTIDNFTYTGQDNYQYQIRYRTQDNAGNWSVFSYGRMVTIDLNDPPTATNLSVAASDLCVQPAPFYVFNWTYSDPNTDEQSRYRFQVDNNSDFSSKEVDINITGLSDPSPTIDSQSIIVATQPGANQLAFNTTYYWRVRVFDEHDLASTTFIQGSPFTTPVYHYPACDFTSNPEKPNAEETVYFIDTSTCWDEDPINGSDCSILKGDSFLWTITSGDPSSSTGENPSSSFSLPGNYNVTLQVTDSGGHTCSKTKSVRVDYPVPKWKEILPW